MSLEQIQKLSDEEICIKVAELRGLTVQECVHRPGEYYVWSEERNKQLALNDDNPEIPFDDGMMVLPNYPQDLNAMHEVEMSMNHGQRETFRFQLYRVLAVMDACSPNVTGDAVHATARQRAIAFVMATNTGGEK